MSIDVLAIPGSLRRESLTTALMQLVIASLDPAIDASIVDQVAALPLYNSDIEGEHAPAVVNDLRAAVRASSGLIIAVPEYNASLPGGLKNWFDWVSRPPKVHALVGKPVLLVGGSPGPGGAQRALTWFQDILGKLGALTPVEPLSVSALGDALDGTDGRPTPELLALVQHTAAAWSAAVLSASTDTG